MSLIDPNNPALWSDGTPRSMFTGFTRGLSDRVEEPLFRPSPMARINPGRKEKRPVEQRSKDGALIRAFPSITEAAQSTFVSEANIVRVASGTRKSAGGYRWRYATPTN